MEKTLTFNQAINCMQQELANAQENNDYETIDSIVEIFAQNSSAFAKKGVTIAFKDREPLVVYEESVFPAFSTIEDSVQTFDKKISWAIRFRELHALSNIVDFYIDNREELETQNISIEKHLKKYPDLLLTSSSMGQKHLTKQLIKLGYNVNCADPETGNTPLIENAHIWRAHPETWTTSTLIKAGADVNLANKKGDTPLIIHADSENYPAVCMLIEAGADVNAANQNGNTALMAAASGGYLKIVRELIKAGANINAANKKGNTVLMKGASSGDLQIVKELVRAEVDIKAVNLKGNNALAQTCNSEIKDFLIQQGINAYTKTPANTL